MIYGFIHPGSGIGNQLHRYVATRVLAMDKGYDFSMIGREHFKCKSFMDVSLGTEYMPYHVEERSGKVIAHTEFPLWEEKKVIENGVDISGYDPEFNFIKDGTLIDGEFQDPGYFAHRMDDIDLWLKVEELDVSQDVCVIGFRGGEFYTNHDLGLPKSYYEEAVKHMKFLNPVMEFEVHTDDEVLAQRFFPEYPVVHDPGFNWRSVRSAKYSIISNSSFYIIPRLLRHNRFPDSVTLAPRYWGRHNTKVWSLPQNYYKEFIYI